MKEQEGMFCVPPESRHRSSGWGVQCYIPQTLIMHLFQACAKCQQGKDMAMNGSHILIQHWEELSKILNCPAMEQASEKVVSCLSL